MINLFIIDIFIDLKDITINSIIINDLTKMININIFIKGKFIKIFQIICNLINSLKANKFERDLIRISYNYKFHNQSKYSLWNTLNTFNKVYKKILKVA